MSENIVPPYNPENYNSENIEHTIINQEWNINELEPITLVENDADSFEYMIPIQVNEKIISAPEKCKCSINKNHYKVVTTINKNKSKSCNTNKYITILKYSYVFIHTTIAVIYLYKKLIKSDKNIDSNLDSNHTSKLDKNIVYTNY